MTDTNDSHEDAPETLYAWMIDAPNPESGMIERVALVASRGDGKTPPMAMISCDLRTALSMAGAAQQAANSLGMVVSLYAWEACKNITQLQPKRIISPTQPAILTQ